LPLSLEGFADFICAVPVRDMNERTKTPMSDFTWPRSRKNPSAPV
jgi:hypothetical protein